MNIIINDLPITSSYRVYDIALLPVVGLRSVDGVLYIDTRTGNSLY